ADIRDAPLRIEVAAQGGGALGCQTVRTATVVTLQSLDEALALKSSQSFVQRARCNAHIGKGLDVLRQRVAVLWPLGEAGENQRCRLRHTAHHISATGISSSGLTVAGIPLVSPGLTRDSQPSRNGAWCRRGY